MAGLSAHEGDFVMLYFERFCVHCEKVVVMSLGWADVWMLARGTKFVRRKCGDCGGYVMVEWDDLKDKVFKEVKVDGEKCGSVVVP